MKEKTIVMVNHELKT